MRTEPKSRPYYKCGEPDCSGCSVLLQAGRAGAETDRSEPSGRGAVAGKGDLGLRGGIRQCRRHTDIVAREPAGGAVTEDGTGIAGDGEGSLTGAVDAAQDRVNLEGRLLLEELHTRGR